MRMSRADEGDVATVRRFDHVRFNAFFGKCGDSAGKVINVKREEVHAFPTLVDELRNGAFFPERFDYFNLGVADRQECVANAQSRDIFRFCFTIETKILVVRRYRSFKIFDRNHHVIQPLRGKATVPGFS